MSPHRVNRIVLHAGRGLSALIAMLGCAAVIAGCGAASSTTTRQKGARGRAAFLAFSECMRSHGVTNFPDPSSSGGIQLSSSSGINPFSPSFKSAQTSCRKLLPGGGPPSHPSEQDKKRMLQISECMRRHGITDFPDPTTTPPSSPAGYGEILNRNGVVLAIPSTINAASPAFQHASAACGFSH
jgi:hypothetical protein